MNFEHPTKLQQKKKIVLWGSVVGASLLVIAIFGHITQDSATNFRNPRYFIGRNVNTIFMTGSLTWLNLQDRVKPDPPPTVDYDTLRSTASTENSHTIYLPEVVTKYMTIAAECLSKDIPVGAIPGQPGLVFWQKNCDLNAKTCHLAALRVRKLPFSVVFTPILTI